MGQAGGLLRTPSPPINTRAVVGNREPPRRSVLLRTSHPLSVPCVAAPVVGAFLPSRHPPISTCMAAIPQWKRAIGFGKRLSDHIPAGGAAPPRCPPATAARAAARRGVHASVYDKNPEEHVRPALVPDDVIQPHPAGKYWGPNPSTGVFGPSDAPASAAAASPGNGGGCDTTTSVLDQKVWFRPVEGVDTHLA